MRRTLPSNRSIAFTDRSTGLLSAEVPALRSRFGDNTIIPIPRSGWPGPLRDALRDPMIWFLAGTSLLFLALGERVEAAVLGAALAPIIGMDVYLHRRTQASTEALAGRLATTATVLRDGTVADIPSADLVPGDLVLVHEGDSIPADGVVVGGAQLQVDESALTGEAMPVPKTPLAAWPDAAEEVPIEDAHWAFAGTRLLTNTATQQVVFTGRETYYGEIVASARSGAQSATPLQRTIGSLTKALVIIALLVCIGLAAIRLYQGYGALDAVLSAVTLAIAALPEEFPIVFTVFLGVGVYRLAKKQALVRRAVVVENIGRVSCICSDKTGTLTEGRLRLAHLKPAPGVADRDLLELAGRSSRPTSADPLDIALLESVALPRQMPVATFAFTEDRRKEVLVYRLETGWLRCCAKGAPETIFAMCSLTEDDRHAWERETSALAASGHKVIACAEWLCPPAQWNVQEPDRGFRLVGLVAFEDPVREDVPAAVAQARSAAIRLIMVTGDHPQTASAIATEIGIGRHGSPRVILGEGLDRILAHPDHEGLADIDVVARAMPAQKLALVQALQSRGEIVAVTGDGVNDVPALKGADVGIAMGERGTRSAREVASIVLLDDNFRTIVRAIAEGRQLLCNLRLSFAYLLMVHIPLVATAALVPLAGSPLLYLPVHIVWLELMIHPTALLVFQQETSSQTLRAAARPREAGLFRRREWAVLGLVGLTITLTTLLGYERSLSAGHDVAHARTMALVALIVASATVTAGLSRLANTTARIISGLPIASAVIFVQTPAIADLLHLSRLHLDDWLLAMAGGAVSGALSAWIPRMGRARS